MSRIPSTVRTARKRHRCLTCHGPIQPGERYTYHVLPPDDPDVGNQHWWYGGECADCCKRYDRPIPAVTA